MKKVILMLGFAGFAVLGMAQVTPSPMPAGAPAQNVTPAPDPNAPEFKWESTTVEYGDVTKGDENAASKEFKFTNVGKSALIIGDCKGSCGCTVPTCPKEPIMPGGKGSIKVKYDVNRVGPFTKTVTVTSNAKNANETLKIQGKVIDPNPSPTADPTVKPAPVAPAPATTPH